MKGDCDKISKIVKNGIDPNIKMIDWYDSTPLGWAASFGRLDSIITLI